jgi:RNA polymerase sigma-70 factor (ECF subfamily)
VGIDRETIDALPRSDGPDTELLERGAREVYAYAIRLTGGDRSLAQDLVQEALLAWARRWCDWDAAALEIGWMIVVARRRFLDHLRRTEREARRLSVVAEPDGAEPDWSRVDGGEALACLGRLSADHRAALVLRYVDDLSVPEVAELMGRSIAATESLLARGRRRLAGLVEAARDG